MNFSQLLTLSEHDFRALWDDDRSKIISAIAKKHDLPFDLVQELTVLDSEAMDAAMAAGGARRKDSLKTKITGRFTVIDKNRKSLAYLANLFDNTADRNFLDVGCGMGITMHDARRLGFKSATGLEIDPSFVKRGDIVQKHLKDPDVNLHLSDFLTHAFDHKFDLICFFDVFEHVADRDLALARIDELLTKDGVVFVYQGNSRSSEIVRVEPHYRVPALSLLPRADQIRILKGMGKIRGASDFVVEKWPELGFFSSHPKLKCHLNTSGQNLRGGRAHTGYDDAVRRLRGMAREPKVWEFAGSDSLHNADQKGLIAALEQLVEEMEKTHQAEGEAAVYRNFLIGSWEILLTRKTRRFTAEGFETIG